LALVLGSVLSIFFFLRANRSRESQTALIRLCDDIRSDVSTAHLWFEEAIAGDPTHDVQRDVLAPIGNVHGRVQETLDPDGVSAHFVGDTQADFESLATELELMMEVTRERWSDKDGTGRIGGALDQKYDGIYENIMDACSRINTQVSANMSADMRRAAQSAGAVNLLVLVLLLAGGGVAMRFWAKRA
jgi:hypothetical protein